MHRGIAKRTIFESRQDMRFFLAQLGKAVRRGLLEVHAYCLLHNHFHLLVRSVTGELSTAMRRILNTYVRYFNRRRRRDGPLFRGRFQSKPVGTLAYRRILVRYIDDNAVSAGLAAAAARYAWGSARFYAERSGPIWLERSWVESEVCRCSALDEYRPEFYGAAFGSRIPQAVRDWVRRRLHGRGCAHDELDDLLGAAPDAVRSWMTRKSLLADGTSPGQALTPPEFVESSLESQASGAAWPGRAPDLGETALPGMLRAISGLSLREISARLGLRRSTAAYRVQRHGERIHNDERYAALCAKIASDALSLMGDEAGFERPDPL